MELVAATPGIGDWTSSYLRLVSRPGHAQTPRWPREPVAHDDLEPGVLHDNPLGRLRALDARGIDEQLLHPGGLDAATTFAPEEGAAFMAAYNRYITSYCEANPERLKAVIQVHGQEPIWAAREIREWADHPAVAGVTVHLMADVTPDHPNFATVWDAIAATELTVYWRPGALARLWPPARLLSYLQGSGVLDRWPGLRFAFVGFTEAIDADARVSCPWGSHFPFDAPAA